MTMAVQFILMTIAFVIMLIVAILQQRRIKELNKKYHDLYDEGFQKYYGFGKLYRRKYKYMVIENAGDNRTMNDTAQKSPLSEPLKRAAAVGQDIQPRLFHDVGEAFRLLGAVGVGERHLLVAYRADGRDHLPRCHRLQIADNVGGSSVTVHLPS